jgi:hypothetical protein
MESEPIWESLTHLLGETFLFGGARGGRQGSQDSGTPDAAGCRSPDPGTGPQTSAADAGLIIQLIWDVLLLTIAVVIKYQSLSS